MKRILVDSIKTPNGVYLLFILALILSTGAPSFAEEPVHTSKWLFDTATEAYNRAGQSHDLKDWAKAAIYYTAYIERDTAMMQHFPEHRWQVLSAWEYSKAMLEDASNAFELCKENCRTGSLISTQGHGLYWEVHLDEQLLRMANTAYDSARNKLAYNNRDLWDWATAAMYYAAYLERNSSMQNSQLRGSVVKANEIALTQLGLALNEYLRVVQPCEQTCPAVAQVRGKQTNSTPGPAPEYPYTFVYGEAFQDGQAQGWTLQQGWAVSSGILVGVGHSWARYNGGDQWYDSRVRFRVRLARGSGIHFNYRLSNQGRYFIGFREGGMYLSKTAPWGTSSYDNLVTSNQQHSPDVWYNVEIAGKGPHIRVWVNDVKELDYTDPNPLLSGTIAFENLENSSTAVDDIIVSVPYVEPNPGQQTFDKPTVDSYRLDWCYYNGSECGSRAATEWCKTKGFTGASDFQTDPNVGQQGIPTKVLGTGTICNASYCDSFKSITCTK